METKIIIAGSRTLDDRKDVIMKHLDKLLYDKQIDYIISGKARGADSIGEEWAKVNNVNVIECPADWKNLGRKAGPIRNEYMSTLATHLIAFQDCRENEQGSNGTNHMIRIATKKNIPTKVIRIEQ